MVSSTTLCVVLNIVASSLSWTAFGLGLSSVTSRGWYYFVEENVRLSLWWNCTNDDCLILENVEPYLHASRAFMIMMVVFNFLGNLLNIISQTKLNKEARVGSGSVWLISAIFGTIGASVYSSILPQTISSRMVVGHGYILAWIAIGLLYIANPFNNYSAKKMSECEIKPN